MRTTRRCNYADVTNVVHHSLNSVAQLVFKETALGFIDLAEAIESGGLACEIRCRAWGASVALISAAAGVAVRGAGLVLFTPDRRILSYVGYFREGCTQGRPSDLLIPWQAMEVEIISQCHSTQERRKLGS